MKLWLLRPVDDDPVWEPWYDKSFGFVVRAPTERRARLLAQAHGGDERRGHDYNSIVPVWTDRRHSTCTELISEGPEEIVIRDFHSA